MQKEKKAREEKEKKQKDKQPKDSIVLWEKMLHNERKEREKEKQREGRASLAALMEERLCPAMRWDPLRKPRRPALWPIGGRTIQKFAASSGEILGATVLQRCFSIALFQSLRSVGVPVLPVVGGLLHRMKTPTLLIDCKGMLEIMFIRISVCAIAIGQPNSQHAFLQLLTAAYIKLQIFSQKVN